MSEIEYRLAVLVDGELVFKSSYPNSTMLEEELYKADRQVEAVQDVDYIPEEDEDE